MSGDPTAEDVLHRFVLRARRVLDCRLATGRDLAPDVEQRMPTHPIMTWPVADEESVEVAAARLRPILFEKERIHWKRVVELLRLAAGDNAALARKVRAVEREWQTLAKPQPGDGAGPGWVTDRHLGDRFVYADLVHADELDENYPGIVQRLIGAEMWAHDGIEATRHTLDLILELREQGRLELPEMALTTQVTSEGQRTFYFPEAPRGPLSRGQKTS